MCKGTVKSLFHCSALALIVGHCAQRYAERDSEKNTKQLSQSEEAFTVVSLLNINYVRLRANLLKPRYHFLRFRLWSHLVSAGWNIFTQKSWVAKERKNHLHFKLNHAPLISFRHIHNQFPLKVSSLWRPPFLSQRTERTFPFMGCIQLPPLHEGNGHQNPFPVGKIFLITQEIFLLFAVTRLSLDTDGCMVHFIKNSNSWTFI